MDTRNAYVRLVRQNFAAMNLGAMFVPAGHLDPYVNRIAARLTPSIFAGTKAAPAPVTYSRPTANARPRLVGMITPSVRVNPK